MSTEKLEVVEKEVNAEIEKQAARYPESQKREVRESFAAGTPNRIRLQQQLKVVKLLSELVKNCYIQSALTF